MDSQAIERYLQELGDELVQRKLDILIRLMIVGRWGIHVAHDWK